MKIKGFWFFKLCHKSTQIFKEILLSNTTIDEEETGLGICPFISSVIRS